MLAVPRYAPVHSVSHLLLPLQSPTQIATVAETSKPEDSSADERVASAEAGVSVTRGVLDGSVAVSSEGLQRRPSFTAVTLKIPFTPMKLAFK